MALSICESGPTPSGRVRISALALLALVGAALARPPGLFAQDTIRFNDLMVDSSPAAADSLDMNGGIIYGPGYAYYLHADSGWVMDHSLEAVLNANSVFYQNGYPPAGAPVYIISMVWSKDSAVTLDDVITSYADGFMATYDDATVEVCPLLTTSLGNGVPVRQLSTESFNYHERIAFCDCPRVVVGLSMWSRYQQNFEACIVNLANTVRSFKFLTDKVRIDPSPADSTQK